MLGSPGTPGPTPTPGPVSRLPFNAGFNSMYPSIPQPSSMADAMSHYSSMNSLSSMSTSCLQNRDPSSYYSMFHHDPLSSLSTYGRSCGVASQSAANMGSYGSSLTSSSSSSGSSGKNYLTLSIHRSYSFIYFIQESLAQECQCHFKFQVNLQTLPLTIGPDSSNRMEQPEQSCEQLRIGPQ